MPTLHVNADDGDAVVRAARLATDYWREFRQEVCIDLVGYRRQGHNEVDDATFTQPLYTAAAAQRPPAAEIYARKLIEEGAATEAEVEAARGRHRTALEAADVAALLSAEEGGYFPGDGSYNVPRDGSGGGNTPSARWAPMWSLPFASLLP